MSPDCCSSPFYYLFYSGNGYANPHYFSGVARFNKSDQRLKIGNIKFSRSSSVTGPYEKQRYRVSQKKVLIEYCWSHGASVHQ